MDEPKLRAQQRFDLLDWTRLMAHIQGGLGDAVKKAMGQANAFPIAGGAFDRRRAPVKLVNLFPEKVGAPSLNWNIYRVWPAPSTDVEASIYDKDGYHMTGQNSPTVQNISVTDTGGTRYIQVRRATSDDTSEARKHYSSTLGKYTNSVNTRTIDDWEIRELGTSAYTDAVAAAAGWIDVCSISTTGGGDSSLLSWVGSSLAEDLYTWSALPPFIDQSVDTPFEAIKFFREIIRRMRHGTGAVGSPRLWTYDPTHDACFENEGGIRFASGETVATGLQDAYVRLKDAGLDVYTLTPDTPADGDDLHFLRCRGAMVGGAAANPIDTSTYTGYCYGNSTGAKALETVSKWWSVDASGMLPAPKSGGNTNSPWVGAVVTNEWYLGTTAGVLAEEAGAAPNEDYNLGWRIDVAAGGAGALALGLHIPLTLPHGCRIEQAKLRLAVDAGGMHASHRLRLFVFRRSFDNASGGSVTVVNVAPPALNNYGAGQQTITETMSAASAVYTINNELYSYYAVLAHELTGAVAGTDQIRVLSLSVETSIREASGVY